MAEGRKMGVTIVQLMNDNVSGRDPANFPGIAAWLKGAGKTYNDLNREHPSNDWRRLDADNLVTGNPEFWQMYYEVVPADPGLFMLHAGALLAAGDANRCGYVLRLFFHSGNVDEQTRRYLISIYQYSQQFQEPSHALVQKGVKQHDAGEYDAALASYRQALDLWPRNGWAHYEVGHTLRTKNKTVTQNEASVAQAFARARRFQPMQMAAWQGKKSEIPGFEGYYEHIMGPWEKSLKSLDYQMTDAELEAFANALQEAEIDDLALAARQILIHKRGRYIPEDHPFITTSLRRLAPGKETESTLKKLAGAEMVATEMYIPSPGSPGTKKK
ncbi:tetratricopeptide repeat protein [Roseimicrobium sp. ORNL1]|uniref:tetratricopeptide repeat protein n=1 Tax=Roseimicrobium sp. ORNL1 TaxID=2711231 RepID=UPI0019804BB3|nr:tetratricopeptide repeat protein [Roseimicrobium sp. ORNL1]